VKSPAEIEAEGRAKLDEFLAGTRDGNGVLWRPEPAVDPRPRCPRCDAPVEVEDAHLELLGVLRYDVPRAEFRCDPATLRAYRSRLNAQARAAGRPEPFPTRSP
jgi:hypothetical protein